MRKLTLANTHADRSKKQQVTATKLLDHVETWEGRCDVDAVGDDLDNERVLEPGTLEVLCSVVD